MDVGTVWHVCLESSWLDTEILLRCNYPPLQLAAVDFGKLGMSEQLRTVRAAMRCQACHVPAVQDAQQVTARTGAGWRRSLVSTSHTPLACCPSHERQKWSKHEFVQVRGADVLVGYHGAALTLSLFMREESALVEIQAEYR